MALPFLYYTINIHSKERKKVSMKGRILGGPIIYITDDDFLILLTE